MRPTSTMSLPTRRLGKGGAQASQWRDASPRPAAPDAATYETLASWLEMEIDRVALARPNPGRTDANPPPESHGVSQRDSRPSRAHVDVVSLLPGDDTSDTGFDNNADVLSITTSQLERYLSAARKITRLATGLPRSAPGTETSRFPCFLCKTSRQSEDLPVRISRWHRDSPSLSSRWRVSHQSSSPKELSRLHHGDGNAAPARHLHRWRLTEAVYRRRERPGESRPTQFLRY